MRRMVSKFRLMASLLTACMLAACSVGDSEEAALLNMNEVVLDAVYEGEWTVNREVVDTARLEVTSVLKVRLPEMYLGTSCLEREYGSSATPHVIAYSGQPAVMSFRYQGYSDNATFNSLMVQEGTYGAKSFFNQASFTVAIDGVSHRVDLLSSEPGNAVYRNDNGLWTIGFTVDGFCVTNLETSGEELRTPHNSIVLYYSAKKRIR